MDLILDLQIRRYLHLDHMAVESIDYTEDKIQIKGSGQEFMADRVIITVPLKMLQKGSITFSPELPSSKKEAIAEATVWDGCKAFLEFSEKFYPAITAFGISPETAGQKIYYDAAYGQDTSQHILGLFAVGTAADPYVQLSDEELKNYMLQELDEIFDNRASASYVKHTFQNWNDEEFIQGAYLFDHEKWRRVRELGESVDNKLFFAGEAYTDGGDWGSVHAAARAARRVVDELS
ncbi:MAG: FAD-dependent oxidoreductase [Bacteroidota bacterium]